MSKQINVSVETKAEVFEAIKSVELFFGAVRVPREQIYDRLRSEISAVLISSVESEPTKGAQS